MHSVVLPTWHQACTEAANAIIGEANDDGFQVKQIWPVLTSDRLAENPVWKDPCRKSGLCHVHTQPDMHRCAQCCKYVAVHELCLSLEHSDEADDCSSSSITYLKDPTAANPFPEALYSSMLAAVQLAGHGLQPKRWAAMILQDDVVDEALSQLDRLEVCCYLILSMVLLFDPFNGTAI
jgi:hypothetical protein